MILLIFSDLMRNCWFFINILMFYWCYWRVQPIMLNEVQVKRAGEADVTAFQLDHGDKTYVLKAINAKERFVFAFFLNALQWELYTYVTFGSGNKNQSQNNIFVNLCILRFREAWMKLIESASRQFMENARRTIERNSKGTLLLLWIVLNCCLQLILLFDINDVSYNNCDCLILLLTY